MRRLRAAEPVRRLVRETRLDPAQFILPRRDILQAAAPSLSRHRRKSSRIFAGIFAGKVSQTGFTDREL
jgi:hypothetical protein